MDSAAVNEEHRRMRRLRVMVDLAAVVLRDRPLSPPEAEELIEQVRTEVLKLFPDKGEVFDLIYRPRFRRLIQEQRAAVRSGSGSAQR